MAELRELFGHLNSISTRVWRTDLLAIPLADLAARLRQWQAAPESLSRWVAYYVRRRGLHPTGLAGAGRRNPVGAHRGSEVVARCEMAYYEEMIRDAFRQHPELGDVRRHSRTSSSCGSSRSSTRRGSTWRGRGRHAPTSSDCPRGGSDVGEVGVVRREIQKKRRHLPIRKLLAQAGRAVQAIKPVFMMSPISVAQYLEPGAIEFDLLADRRGQPGSARSMRSAPWPVPNRSSSSAIASSFHRPVSSAGCWAKTVRTRRPELSSRRATWRASSGLCCAQRRAAADAALALPKSSSLADRRLESRVLRATGCTSCQVPANPVSGQGLAFHSRRAGCLRPRRLRHQPR